MVYKKYLSNINNYFTLQNNNFGVFIQFYMNCNYKMSAITIYNQYRINIFCSYFYYSSTQKCQCYSLQWIRFNIDLPSNVVPMIWGRRKALYSECPRCFSLLLLPFLIHSPSHVLVEPAENKRYIRKYLSLLIISWITRYFI